MIAYKVEQRQQAQISQSLSTRPSRQNGDRANPTLSRPLRLRSLPTLLASPSPSAPAFIADMAPSFISDSTDFFDKALLNIQQLSLNSRSLVPTPPDSPSSASACYQSIAPPPYDRLPPKSTLPSLNFDFDSFYPEETAAFPKTSSSRTSGRAMFEIFEQTRSRVIRVFNLPTSINATQIALSQLFFPGCAPHFSGFSSHVPTPSSLWTTKEEFGGRKTGQEDSIWVIFRTHEEACAALELAGSTVSISTALEVDLEPYVKLRRFEMRFPPQLIYTNPAHLPPSPSSPIPLVGQRLTLDVASLMSQVQVESRQPRYELSTNPPNAKAAFRPGDWICASPYCGAHNFGRNIVCIGCSASRPNNGPSSPTSYYSPQSPTLPNRLASPRFASKPTTSPTLALTPSPTFGAFPPPYGLEQLLSTAPASTPTKPSQSTHHLLTPSGRALALGGRVQNVSSDPYSPCVIFWPDNEPLPEPGQVRPAILAQIQQPPILNTGNKGPIEHQPGDWICQKCDYLNWRRRKVCQTCFPYAEGNGDSVSPATQAERIALLSSLLAQTQINAETLQSPSSQISFPSSSAPLHQMQSAFSADGRHSTLAPSSLPRGSTQVPTHGQSKRSFQASEFPVGNIVYQTPSTSVSSNRYPNQVDDTANAPLPAFLRYQMKEPGARTPASLSPTSTSSADLSIDEYDDVPPSPASFGPTHGFYTRQYVSSGAVSNASGSTSSLTLAGGSNIWAMDRAENNKNWNAVALPSPDFLVGPRRSASGEMLRAVGL